MARCEAAGQPLAEFTHFNEALFFEDIERQILEVAGVRGAGAIDDDAGGAERGNSCVERGLGLGGRGDVGDGDMKFASAGCF